MTRSLRDIAPLTGVPLDEVALAIAAEFGSARVAETRARLWTLLDLCLLAPKTDVASLARMAHECEGCADEASVPDVMVRSIFRGHRESLAGPAPLENRRRQRAEASLGSLGPVLRYFAVERDGRIRWALGALAALAIAAAVGTYGAQRAMAAWVGGRAAGAWARGQ